jgi:hypothetical protein
MKVTNTDVRALVLEAMADRERTKPKVQGRGEGKQLIDALIVDEMQKFTSLDHFEEPLPSGEGSGGGQALDPGSFIDTSGWADEVGLNTGSGLNPVTPAPVRAVGSPTNARVAPVARNATPPTPVQTSRPTGKPPTQQPQRAAASAPALGEVDSLQQILEPDRTGVNQKVDRGGRTTTIAIVVALVLAVAVGGGLVVFKDQIFGSTKGPTKTSSPKK